MANLDCMNKINSIIEHCKFNLDEIAKYLNINVKTLYNYRYQKKEIPFETLVELINIINRMLEEYNQKTNSEIKYLTLAHCIKLYDKTHTLADVDLTDIRNKQLFLYRIESLEKKYDISLFEETLNSEYSVLRLIFNNINLKDYVDKMNVVFNKIYQLKNNKIENSIELPTDALKELRFDIDKINQEFFQALIDKILAE